MILNNCLILNDYNNIKINFKNYLKLCDSIIIKNSTNVDIKINSPINKIVFINCKNVILVADKLISGMDIDYCKNCNIFLNVPIYINIFKSNIILNTNNKIKNNTKIIHQYSTIKFVII